MNHWWDPQKLLAFKLYTVGKKDAEIAKDLVDKTPETVYRWRRHPKWQARLQRHTEDVLAQLTTRQIEITTEALEKVISIMQQGRSWERIQLTAALALLDRGAPVKKTLAVGETGEGVRIIVVNNNQLPRERTQELLEFEKDMGYDRVVSPMLVSKNHPALRAAAIIDGEATPLPAE